MHSFVEKMNSDPLYSTKRQAFVVKLPYTTNGQIAGLNIARKFIKGGVKGVLQALKEWAVGKYSALIMGYIPYAIIQPDIECNTEAKVYCFDGEPIGRNPHKCGRGTSDLGRDDEELFGYAREVCAILKRECPYMMTDGLLRIDFFKHRGRYLLNEVEGNLLHFHVIVALFDLKCMHIAGFEAATHGCDQDRLDDLLLNWWYRHIKTGIEYVLERRALLNAAV